MPTVPSDVPSGGQPAVSLPPAEALAEGERRLAQQRPGSGLPDAAAAIALEAYHYLYPLLVTDLTRRQMTRPVPPDFRRPGFGPANTFDHDRAYPTADDRVIVRANWDTLYSYAWLDLTQGPVTLNAQPTHQTWYSHAANSGYVAT